VSWSTTWGLIEEEEEEEGGGGGGTRVSTGAASWPLHYYYYYYYYYYSPVLVPLVFSQIVHNLRHIRPIFIYQIGKFSNCMKWYTSKWGDERGAGE